MRFSVLQAGVYGSPQGRRRVIFWGARRGVPLPEFPIPTHNFETTQWAVQLDTGLKLDHVSRDPDRPHRGAPLRAVTVDDAISDLVRFSHLYCCGAYWKSHHHDVPTVVVVIAASASPQPKFDWYVVSFVRVLSVNLTRALFGWGCIRDDRKDPHVVFDATREDRAEAKRRAAIGIPAFEAVSSRGVWDQSDEDAFPGYPDGVQYASEPRTSYQARARQDIAEDADVELHYTARFSEAVVER